VSLDAPWRYVVGRDRVATVFACTVQGDRYVILVETLDGRFIGAAADVVDDEVHPLRHYASEPCAMLDAWRALGHNDQRVLAAALNAALDAMGIE
jgi:hypothetical protein